jgi:hypothetical protein
VGLRRATHSRAIVTESGGHELGINPALKRYPLHKANGEAEIFGLKYWKSEKRRQAAALQEMA